MARPVNPEKPTAQFNLDLPTPIALALDELGRTIHQNRGALARSILIQGLRKIQTLKEAPSTLGDVENAILNGIE
jgi:hypothetical protein